MKYVSHTYLNTYLFCTSSEKIDHCLLFEKKYNFFKVSYCRKCGMFFGRTGHTKVHHFCAFVRIKWHYHIWDSMAACYETRWQTCSPNNKYWPLPLGVRTKRPVKHFDNAGAARLTRWLPLCSHCVLSGTIQAVAMPIYLYIKKSHHFFTTRNTYTQTLAKLGETLKLSLPLPEFILVFPFIFKLSVSLRYIL